MSKDINQSTELANLIKKLDPQELSLFIEKIILQRPEIKDMLKKELELSAKSDKI
ncbi:MAG: hypothetical protein WCL30_01350 [Pseudomonadota bacterium]